MAVGSSFPSRTAAATAPHPAAVSPAPANPEFLTTDEAGAFLRLSPRTLEKQRVLGGGPRFRKFGARVVYAAVDLRLDRDVALKVMREDLARDPSFVERFRKEARSAARLSDPHVVAVHDQGEDDGLVFLAMELVEDVLRRRQIRVTDTEGDDIDTFSTFGRNPLRYLNEQVGRERINALRKLHRGCPG